jgi:acyl-CoA thioester hydrolase
MMGMSLNGIGFRWEKLPLIAIILMENCVQNIEVINMNGFSKKCELRIDWSELDAFGHVNNLAIMKYVQAARVRCLDAAGLMQSQAEQGVGPILASIACQFRKPLFYPGRVTVYSRVDEIKNTSFKIQYEIYSEKNEIAAEAKDIIVLFDFNKQTKLPISEDLRKKLLIQTVG